MKINNNTEYLQALAKKWEGECDKKWKEEREKMGHDLYAWLPHLTHQCDLEKRREVTDKIIIWSKDWFAKRGVDVICERYTGHNPNGETLALRLA